MCVFCRAAVWRACASLYRRVDSSHVNATCTSLVLSTNVSVALWCRLASSTGGPSRCHIRPEESKLAGVFLADLLFSRVIAVCFMSPVRDCCCNHGVFSSLPQISRYTELGVVRMWWEILWVIFFLLQGTEWSFGRAHQNTQREWFIGYKGWQTSIWWRGLNTVVLWFLHKTWNKYEDFPAFHSVLKERNVLNRHKRWLLDILVAFGCQDF